MNRIRELRQRAGYGLVEFASVVGADVVEVALAEMSVGLVRFDLGIEIARALDISAADLFPLAKRQIEEVEDLEEEELRSALLENDRAAALSGAGLDPDIIPWFAVVHFTSGNTRKYLLSSAEMKRLRKSLGDGDGNGFVSFLGDCRNVVLRVSAIRDITFTHTTGYSHFSSSHSAFEVVVISESSPRPECLEVVPDGGEDGDGPRPFADLLECVSRGAMPAFVSIGTEFGEERFLRAGTIEVIEVPIGVVMPGIYFDASVDARLAAMETVGNA